MVGEESASGAQRVWGAPKYFHALISAIIHLSKPIDSATLRVNLNENYGLWVILLSVVTNVPFR